VPNSLNSHNGAGQKVLSHQSAAAQTTAETGGPWDDAWRSTER